MMDGGHLVVDLLASVFSIEMEKLANCSSSCSCKGTGTKYSSNHEPEEKGID